MADFPLLEWVENRRETTWAAFYAEAKTVGFLAVPLVAINLSQFLIQTGSLMVVGHLDQLALSSTAIAVSLAAVSGFSVLVSSSPFSSMYVLDTFGSLYVGCGFDLFIVSLMAGKWIPYIFTSV